jgi:hypothetical protein
MTVSWPSNSKLGYQVVNVPSGQPTDPDISTDESPLSRAHWSFFDLVARSPGKDRFAIVVGPKEFLNEENRDKGVGWGAGFLEVDSYLPKTTNKPGRDGI